MKFRKRGGRTLVALISAMLLVYAFAGGVAAEHDEAGPAVTPTPGTFPGGPPACPDGEGIRFGDDAEDDAPLTDGASAGGVTIELNATETTVDFSTDGTVLVAHVYVKGGIANAQNHYNYIDSAIDSVAHDDGLATPTGQQISHIDFCLVDAPDPTPVPTDEPTAPPTDDPTPAPTDEPTAPPTDDPSPDPTDEPTAPPTNDPTPAPTNEPTAPPTDDPSPDPTDDPSPAPTDEPKPALTPPPTSAAPVTGASQPSMTLVLLLVGMSAAAWLLLRPVSLTPVRERIDRDGR